MNGIESLGLLPLVIAAILLEAHFNCAAKRRSRARRHRRDAEHRAREAARPHGSVDTPYGMYEPTSRRLPL